MIAKVPAESVRLPDDLVDVDTLVLDDDGELVDTRVVGARHAGVSFARARFTDVELVRCDLSGADFSESQWRRVRCVDCRFSSAELGEAVLRSVAFVDCRADDANFRLSKLLSVRFEQCALTGAEFDGAALEDLVFGGCDLAGADVGHVRCNGLVDLRGSRLDGVRGIASLKGATIGREQLIGLAPALAVALGLKVSDADDD